MINISVVQFNHVQYIVQVCSWWWTKYLHGLIGSEGICYDLGDIILPLGYSSVNSFVVCTTLQFDPGFYQQSSSWIKFRQDIIIGNLILSSFVKAISSLKVETIDSIYKISVMLVIYSLKNNYTLSDTSGLFNCFPVTIQVSK